MNAAEKFSGMITATPAFCLSTARRALASSGTVETSSKESYGATQRFYDRVGYRQAGRVDNFYADGDHLLILVHEVDA